MRQLARVGEQSRRGSADTLRKPQYWRNEARRPPSEFSVGQRTVPYYVIIRAKQCSALIRRCSGSIADFYVVARKSGQL